MRCVFAATTIAAMIAGPAAHATLVVSKKPTQNMTCDRGTCSATAANAVLNIKDLKTLLHISDLTLVAGNTAQDIVFDAPFSWTSPRQLTLNAARSLVVKQPIAVEGTGALDLEYGHAAIGTFSVVKKGRIDFWDLAARLTINSRQYLLVADIATMAVYIGGTSYAEVALAKDYDAKADGVYSAAPMTAYFGGTLEGLGHVISNLTVNDATTSGHDGLISDSYGGTFRNIGLSRSDERRNVSTQHTYCRSDRRDCCSGCLCARHVCDERRRDRRYAGGCERHEAAGGPGTTGAAALAHET
jgi:hypothetical protein